MSGSLKRGEFVSVAIIYPDTLRYTADSHVFLSFTSGTALGRALKSNGVGRALGLVTGVLM